MHEPLSSCIRSPTESRSSGGRAFLKWAGGKRQLLPQLSCLLPPLTLETRYYEPFLGSGALFLHLVTSNQIRPELAVLSDTNEKLITAWFHIQNNVDEVVDQLRAIAHTYDHADPVRYYELRERYNSCQTLNIEHTALLIALNRTCFNGLYRENRQGKFNVPRGDYKQPKILDEDVLRAVHAALQGATVVAEGFDAVLQKAQTGDFVYFDPPYEPLSTTSSFRTYHQDGFDQKDQKKLADVYARLTEKGVRAMLSNSNCRFTNQLYRHISKAKIHMVQASRHINSKSTHRGEINEIVVTNYSTKNK